MSKIVLGIGSYSLTIDKFASGYPATYPRTAVSWPEIEFSSRGGVSLTGPSYSPKFVWNFSARLSVADRTLLQRMFAFWLANRATPWVLEDFTMEISEVAPGTRAIATGTTESTDGTTTLYLAKFNAYPTQFPELQELSRAEEVITLQFTEGEVFPRP